MHTNSEINLHKKKQMVKSANKASILLPYNVSAYTLLKFNVMNYIYPLLFCLFLACHKGNESPISTVLQVEQTNLEIPSDGGVFSFKVESSSTWIAESSAAWCTIVVSTAVLSGEVQVNNSGDPRTASITITCDDMIKTVSVIQAGMKGQVPIMIEYELFQFSQTEYKYDAQYRLTAIVKDGVIDTLIYRGNDLVLERTIAKHYLTGEWEEMLRVEYVRTGNTINRYEVDRKFNNYDTSIITLNDKGLPIARTGKNFYGISYSYTYTYDNNNNLLESNFFQRTLLMTVITATYDNYKGVFSDVQTPKWYFSMNGVPDHVFNNCTQQVMKNRLYQNWSGEEDIPDESELVYQDETQSDENYDFLYDAHGYPSSIEIKPRQTITYTKI